MIRWIYVVSGCMLWFLGSAIRPVKAGRLHPWLSPKKATKKSQLRYRFPVPHGYRRVRVRQGSFAWWLRRLPMASKNTPIRDYRGRRLAGQSRRAGVVRLDVGRYNLQQCADSVMRLWGEYLWYRGLQRHYQFRLTSGHRNPWRRWARGDRLKIVRGRMRGWRRRVRRPNASYRSFRKYLRVVMMYSGTASLSRELRRVPRRRIQAGDLLMQGGYPGHVILLLDEVRNEKGESLFLLGQGLMPAQSFHVLRTNQQRLSPWFRLGRSGRILTPSWDFPNPKFYRLPHRTSTR